MSSPKVNSMIDTLIANAEKGGMSESDIIKEAQNIISIHKQEVQPISISGIAKQALLSNPATALTQRGGIVNPEEQLKTLQDAKAINEQVAQGASFGTALPIARKLGYTPEEADLPQKIVGQGVGALATGGLGVLKGVAKVMPKLPKLLQTSVAGAIEGGAYNPSEKNIVAEPQQRAMQAIGGAILPTAAVGIGKTAGFSINALKNTADEIVQAVKNLNSKELGSKLAKQAIEATGQAKNNLQAFYGKKINDIFENHPEVELDPLPIMEKWELLNRIAPMTNSVYNSIKKNPILNSAIRSGKKLNFAGIRALSGKLMKTAGGKPEWQPIRDFATNIKKETLLTVPEYSELQNTYSKTSDSIEKLNKDLGSYGESILGNPKIGGQREVQETVYGWANKNKMPESTAIQTQHTLSSAEMSKQKPSVMRELENYRKGQMGIKKLKWLGGLAGVGGAVAVEELIRRTYNKH